MIHIKKWVVIFSWNYSQSASIQIWFEKPDLIWKTRSNLKNLNVVHWNVLLSGTSVWPLLSISSASIEVRVTFFGDLRTVTGRVVYVIRYTPTDRQYCTGYLCSLYRRTSHKNDICSYLRQLLSCRLEVCKKFGVNTIFGKFPMQTWVLRITVFDTITFPCPFHRFKDGK